jgi:hypothetical protein
MGAFPGSGSNRLILFCLEPIVRITPGRRSGKKFLTHLINEKELHRGAKIAVRRNRQNAA